MVGFDGPTASSEVKRLIRDHAVGHVVLFERNVESPEQVAELVRELQWSARQAGHELPLAVAVDQEGGRVSRLTAPWTVWPPPRVLGRAGSEQTCRRVGEGMAAELLACGIRWNLAPVLDVDTNPRSRAIGERSLGADPERVGRLGSALVGGMQAAGLAACAKHFPGHGDTELDSHHELPRVEHSRARLEDVELRPFRMAIEARVASVMTAHVVYSELDARRPATLSPAVIRQLLRERLGYHGLVVSDDLEMKAITAGWSPDEAALLAAEAGCDVLAFGSSCDRQLTALESLIRAAESERIPWAAMDEVHQRIGRFKRRFLLPYEDPDPRRAREAAGAPERMALALELAERGGVPA
jgi:beta-N-acetylhexosaminidase